MCAFLSRSHRANPHLFSQRNRSRPDISPTTTVRAGRLSNTFCRPRKFPQHLSGNASLSLFSYVSVQELSNPNRPNFVARSLENWAFDFLPAQSVATVSASDVPLQSTETSSVYDFLFGILHDVTPIDVLSFTFVSTVLGIMAAYIFHEVKDQGENTSLGRLEQTRQINTGVVHASSTPPKYGETETEAEAEAEADTETADVWLNLSRPSPFFRSVCAKCPSLSSSPAYKYVQSPMFKKPDYQRQCLSAPDGGSVALDWPAHLDIHGSKDLENIMLLVCGTTEGSREDGILRFSQLVEEHGYFPMVFNPRGCGGSPLTTPRVFSAADSDDVRLAVQFIVKSRPWATILSVGWGLGANVLARYLGEEGSYTPLTAAVCIDNPFDLGSVTRPMSGSRWLDFDHSLSKGLVQILDSSKMLFQGEKKGFDISGALTATSVRDFDRAISRVVHGYTTVEDFYVNTSSGATLEGVQIPLLHIQHLEDYTRTRASIPHNVLERNVYTMLLLSRPSDSKDDFPGAASEWTHAISLEWLTAVEISILKGRHPQLTEFIPIIKLPREWSNAESEYSGASSEIMDQKEVTTIPRTTAGNSYHKEVALSEADMQTYSTQDRLNSHLQARKQEMESTGRSSIPANASDGEGAEPSESPAVFGEGEQAKQELTGEELTEVEGAGRIQVVQVAETVMNVLDVTMPGTLADAQKRQVLKAVGRGETVVTALEEAVPEDVRGKMSAAVSEVVQAQNLSLKIGGSQTPATQIPAGVTDSIQGTLLALSDKKGAPKSELDVSSTFGGKCSDDRGVSGNTAQSDDPTTKEATPGKSGKANKQEKPASNDERKDSEKGTVATESVENSEPAKTGQVSGEDPKDSMQQLDTENKLGGGKKGSGDAVSKGSSNLEDQTNDEDDKGKRMEQPQESAENARKERNETSSGGSSEVTTQMDNPSDKIEGGENGTGQSSSSKKKDNVKDITGQADSVEAVGKSVTENTKTSKDAENKGEMTAPSSNNGLPTPASDASSPDTCGATPNSQPPSLQMPKSDPARTEVPADNSIPPAAGLQATASPSTEVPADTSNSPPPSSQASQSDPPRSDVSTGASNPPPSGSQASQNDARDTETTATPPSPPPENSPPAPAPPPAAAPAPAPANPAPQNPPPESPPVPLPSVGETLQTLTGFDNSTQMAVTNVFGVVENILDQLENESPSTDANSSGEVSAQDIMNQATAEMTKELTQNAPDASEIEDEDGDVRSTDDKQSNEVPLVAPDVQKGHLQSLNAERHERKELKSTGSPVEVEQTAPENGSHISASSRGVEPVLSMNERGHIKDSSARQTGLDTEVQDNRPNPQSTLLLSDNNPNDVQGSPAQDIGDNGFLAESANEKRLKVMAAEIDAEDEETAESSASDQVTAGSNANVVQQDDSRMVTDLVMNALKLEVLRRLGAAGLEALGVDLDKEVARVADAVSEVVMMGKNKLLGSQGLDSDLGGKPGVLNGKSIVTALGSVLGSNSLLGRLLPFGVLAGVVMAALGATYLIVSDDQEEESVQIQRTSSQKQVDTNAFSAQRAELQSANYQGNSEDKSSEELGDVRDELGLDDTERVEHSISNENDEGCIEVEDVTDSASTGDGKGKLTEQTAESKPPHQGKLMGAMAAAMGATAAVASTARSTSEEEYHDSNGNVGGEHKLVPDIAEKALSMVSPVVPRTEAGELDHERLVSVLTDVGQRGGPLTVVGKVALLWGGLRGAMSLADRLLGFLRIKERPLHQRLVGFGGMAVLLWTPVLVPLLPTLLQQWATKSPSGVADAAAGIGLYGALFILVTIWGRRVRDYERPLVSYGLHLFSKAKLRLFAGGLAIGLGLVSGYYGINWLLGYSQFSWDVIVVTNPNFPGALASTILTSWKVLMLVNQSLAMALSVALVEEVLFRAWLQEEIAVDLGYHWAVLLSALAFAVVHWSPAATVGLWFLGVALAGARARTDGDLSFPIGIHAGIASAFSVMNLGGLVHYIAETPSWVTGAYAGNPLAGALGTGMVAALAIALYPRQEDKFLDEK